MTVVEEKRIVTGLIVSTDFINKIHSILDLDYFTNSYLKTIATWCMAFYEEHEKSPFLHIRDIYDSEVPRLKDTEAELIGKVLETLDDQYDENNVNVDYLADSAVDYFRKRELEIAVNNISVLNEKGDYEGAEEVIGKFKRVSVDLDSSSLINLGDVETIREIYRKREEEDKNFFQLPGDLGRYLGNFKRGDVIGYFAPAKKGKSWTLVDNFKHGILNKRKSIFWSIEMTKTEILPRIMKSFVPMCNEEGMYFYPVFDCVLNQTGECVDRLSQVIVRDGEDVLSDPTHVVCTKCMNKINGDHDYEMVVWNDEIFRSADDIFTVEKFMEGGARGKGFKHQLNKYGRLSVHKKYTLTYDRMMRDIESYHQIDGFIPDIFIIDYVDILEIGSRFDDYKKVDEAWKLMARMAGEFNALVITATQANKEGHKAENLDATHQGGYYGKNQHVTMMIGINQKPEEKEQGIIRYGISEARNQQYIPGKTCTVLQDISAGQSYLDSYYQWR